MKFFSIIILSLAACAPLKQSPTTLTQLSDTGTNSRFFEDPEDQLIYDAFRFEFSFTEYPKDSTAFDATCYILDKDERLVGTGALVRSNVIMTAAHVAYRAVDGYIQFEESGPVISICTVWLHPDWLAQDDSSKDIALLKLDCEVADIKPLQIAGSDTRLYRYVSNISIVGCSLGYKKQSLPNKIIYYGKLVSAPSELKLRSTTTTVWFGDSGGPMVLQGPSGDLIIVGVTARFSMFQQKIMDFTATDVRYFSDLLNEVMDIWGEVPH